uniref:Uncharacterized protein n=1 Tax=Oryza rufipogon TaxID=4529 RepID=A0A0E0PM31_ORYRU
MALAETMMAQSDTSVHGQRAVTTVGDWRQEVNAGDGKEAALADIVGGQRGDDKKGDDDSVPQRAVFESFLVKTMSWFSLRSQGKVASVLIVTLLPGDVV